MIWLTTFVTVSIGIAKPMPTLPCWPVSPVEICELIADHLALRVQQRAARVAVVERGVGLDDVVDRVAVRRRDRALERAHDARR